MTNIAVIFGGVSTEHSISVLTAFGAMKNMSTQYEIVPIYIKTSGEWVTGKHLLDAKTYQTEPNGVPCHFRPNDKHLYEKTLLGYKKTLIECAVLAIHGGIYEGGAVQGLLELAGIPHTSPSTFPSALCMDKIATHRILDSLKINNLPFVGGSDPKKLVDLAIKKLPAPWIVKPARSGSSVGVSKATDLDTLTSAVDYALRFDAKALIEPALENFREVNIALMRDKDKIRFSEPEEIEFNGDFYSFDQKYSTKSKEIKRTVPAKLDLKIMDKIYSLTEKVYTQLELNGVVRFDLLIKDNKVYLNEINTIPGSFSFYLWRYSGLNFAKVLHLAIQNAIHTSSTASISKIPTEYNTQILSDLSSLSITNK